MKKYFDSLDDYKHFLETEKKCHTQIGSGGEGICYLSAIDNQVYKLITKTQLRYDIDKIITTNDTDVFQYIFPEELYIVNNQLIGYTTRYIEERNLFDTKTLNFSIFKDDSYFNIDSFIEAYYEILKDTEKLSTEKTAIHDLVLANLLFIGKHFCGIDTTSYTKVNYNPSTTNKQILDNTIKIGINYALTKEGIYPSEFLTDLRKEKDMEKYTRKLSRLINN